MSETQKSRRTYILTIILIFLFLLLAALVYYYLSLVRPRAEKARVEGLTHYLSIYGFGPSPGEMLEHPTDVAVGRNGNLYITDTGHARVVVFTPSGRFLFAFGKPSKYPKDFPGSFRSPLGIAIDKETGEVFIADKSRQRVVVYDENGVFKREFAVPMPLDVAIYDKSLYVSSFGSIFQFDLRGRFINRWGKLGKGRGEFRFPNGLVAEKDMVIVGDSNNARVVALDKKGKVVWVNGKPPEKALDPSVTMGWPGGVAFDDNGFIFVIDALHFDIKVFDKKGKMLTTFGAGHSGSRDGEFYYPTGIAYLGNERFAIADKWNNRVQILRLDLVSKGVPGARKSLAQRLWQVLEPWCPYVFLLLLILAVLVNLFRQRRKEDFSETRIEVEEEI